MTVKSKDVISNEVKNLNFNELPSEGQETFGRFYRVKEKMSFATTK